MTKIEIVEAVAERMMREGRSHVTRTQVAHVVNGMLAAMTEALAKGEEITFSGFGSFKLGMRKARGGRNPRTGERLRIPASKTVKFALGKTLKETLNP
jgi:DNA-binding protein HU-beta